RASDRFIEQLRVSGTYEPSSRTEAALAAALLTWRDEARDEPLNPPPTADDVDIDSYAQPRRIAQRAVVVAGALLAMSSAVATAVDGDPLRPVEVLVDFGVDVGERIAHPSTSEPSSEESSSETLREDIPVIADEPPNMSLPDVSPSDGPQPDMALIGPNDLDTPGKDGTNQNAPPSVTSTDDAPAQDEGEITDGDDPSTDATEDPSTDPTDDPTDTPTTTDDEGQDTGDDGAPDPGGEPDPGPPPGGPSDNDGNGNAYGHANDPNGNAYGQS
ncbi:MAG: hypothetical protein ACRDQD_29965, partial [Nocardioidaceae bacterium]